MGTVLGVGRRIEAYPTDRSTAAARPAARITVEFAAGPAARPPASRQEQLCQ